MNEERITFRVDGRKFTIKLILDIKPQNKVHYYTMSGSEDIIDLTLIEDDNITEALEDDDESHPIMPYKKLGYIFYMFCIRFVYVFKKSTVFIRNWLIFHINYIFLIICFLYVFKNLIKNIELKTYNLYGILTNFL